VKLQIALPIRNGGLGLPKMARQHACMYLASWMEAISFSKKLFQRVNSPILDDLWFASDLLHGDDLKECIEKVKQEAAKCQNTSILGYFPQNMDELRCLDDTVLRRLQHDFFGVFVDAQVKELMDTVPGNR
jgi:hypothetical protein